MKQKSMSGISAKIYRRDIAAGGVIDRLLMVLVVGLLTIAPFFRGLYFRENYILTAAFIGVSFVLLIIKLIKEKISIVESYVDIVFLFLTLVYFLTIFFGISKSNALDGFIKYLAAFMLYKLVYEITKYSRFRALLLDGLVFSGFITALFSLLGSGGIIKLHGIFGWGERLNGPYQYPNATASILGGIFLLNIFLLMYKKSRYIRIAYFVSASTIMLTFLETRSRGAMLTLLAAWALAFLLAETKDKLSLLVYSLASGAISLVFYSKIYSSFIEQKNFGVLFIAFIAATVALGFALEYVIKQIQRVEIKNINRVIIGIFIAFALAGVAAFNLTTPLELTEKQPQRGFEVYQVKPATTYKLELEAEGVGAGTANLNVIVNSVDRAKVRTELYNNSLAIGSRITNSAEFTTNDSTYFITVDFINANPSTGLKINEASIKDAQKGTTIEKLKLNYRFIPNDIAKKINEISLKTESSSERIVFIKDGIKMFKDYPLTGTGAKGWGMLYTKYQSYGYTSAEAHNYYLQTAIESGILGIIALTALFICLIIICINLYMRKGDNSYMLIGIISMLFELLAHAFLDFDFSLFALFMVVVTCLGWLSSIAAQEGMLVLKINKGRRLLNYTALTLSIILIIVSSLIHIGIREVVNGAALAKTDMSKAKAEYQSAMGKDFFNSIGIADYSYILTLEAKKTKDKALINQIYKNYKEIEANDPYGVRHYGNMISFYYMFGYFQDASALADRLIDVQPFKPESYELKANLNYQIVRYYFEQKDYKEVLKYNALILDIERQQEEANKRIIAPFGLTEKTKDLIKAAKTDRETISGLVK